MKLTEEECYEVETGTPTLTVELDGEERMIGYSGFRDAVKKGDNITIRFHDWQVTIEGESLAPLWEQFQMQDIRVIRRSRNPAEGECSIKHIGLGEAQEE